LPSLYSNSQILRAFSAGKGEEFKGKGVCRPFPAGTGRFAPIKKKYLNSKLNTHNPTLNYGPLRRLSAYRFPFSL
jgi:hypothetical protein